MLMSTETGGTKSPGAEVMGYWEASEVGMGPLKEQCINYGSTLQLPNSIL